MDGEQQIIVLDNGTGYIKAGFAGEDNVRAEVPNLVGRPSSTNKSVIGAPGDENKLYVGDEARQYSSVLDLIYPMRSGELIDTEAWAQVMHYVLYTELRVDPSEYKILLTEAPSNPKEKREAMMETLFEKWKAQAGQIQVQAVLALYASGRTTGLVLDCGDGVSHAVPVYAGYGIRNAVTDTNLAGRDVTESLIEGLQTQCGVDMRAEGNRVETGHRIKEAVCYVALDFDGEKKAYETGATKPTSYTMSDGSEIEVGLPCISAPEVLINPKAQGKMSFGQPELLSKSVNKCNVDMRMSLYENIVLTGGTMMMRGIRERLDKDFKEYVPNLSRDKVNMVGSSDKHSVYLGGSILCTLSTFNNLWITREEWDESGREVLETKRLF